MPNPEERESAGEEIARLNAEEARACLEFMKRVDLKGVESQAHAQITFKLGLIANGQPMPKPELSAIDGLKGSDKAG